MRNQNLIANDKLSRKEPKRISFRFTSPILNHTPIRWNCRHHTNGSDITAYVAASRGLEIIATTRQAEGIDARANAQLIVQAVNGYDRHALVIKDLISALELCLKCKGLTWAAEQEADIALKRAREVVGC